MDTIEQYDATVLVWVPREIQIQRTVAIEVHGIDADFVVAAVSVVD